MTPSQWFYSLLRSSSSIFTGNHELCVEFSVFSQYSHQINFMCTRNSQVSTWSVIEYAHMAITNRPLWSSAFDSTRWFESFTFGLVTCLPWLLLIKRPTCHSINTRVTTIGTCSLISVSCIFNVTPITCERTKKLLAMDEERSSDGTM